MKTSVRGDAHKALQFLQELQALLSRYGVEITHEFGLDDTYVSIYDSTMDLDGSDFSVSINAERWYGIDAEELERVIGDMTNKENEDGKEDKHEA